MDEENLPQIGITFPAERGTVDPYRACRDAIDGVVAQEIEHRRERGERKLWQKILSGVITVVYEVGIRSALGAVAGGLAFPEYGVRVGAVQGIIMGLTEIVQRSVFDNERSTQRNDVLDRVLEDRDFHVIRRKHDGYDESTSYVESNPGDKGAYIVKDALFSGGFNITSPVALAFMAHYHMLAVGAVGFFVEIGMALGRYAKRQYSSMRTEAKIEDEFGKTSKFNSDESLNVSYGVPTPDTEDLRRQQQRTALVRVSDIPRPGNFLSARGLYELGRGYGHSGSEQEYSAFGGEDPWGDNFFNGGNPQEEGRETDREPLSEDLVSEVPQRQGHDGERNSLLLLPPPTIDPKKE